MPGQTAKSGLLAKYGQKLNQAVQTHNADATDYGMQRVPPGITAGIGQVIEAKFDVYKTGKSKGEYFFRMAARVIEPEFVEFKGQTIKVRGMTTSIMIPVCDTTNRDGKKTPQDEHIKDILNEMRKVMGEAYTENATGEHLEPLANGIIEAAPFTKFSTSVRTAMKEGDADGVWENWNGNQGLEDYVPPDEGGVTDGNLTKGTAPAASGAPPNKKPPVTTATAAPADEPSATDADYASMALADAAAVAAGDDEAAADSAQQYLTERALAAGIEQNDIDNNLASWEEVAIAIEAAEAGTAGDEPAEVVPEKGAAVKFQVLDAKGQPMRDAKKKVAKPVDCEVTSVNAAKKTVNLKNLVTLKIVPNVPWDQLIYGD